MCSLAKGVTNEGAFIEEALSRILTFMEADGHTGAYQSLIAPVSDSVRFARALNRSVTGSMNDLIKGATYYLAVRGDSLLVISAKLNETPMSALKYEGSRYGCPGRVFAAQVKSAYEGRSAT